MRPRRALPDGRLVRQLMADLLADGTRPISAPAPQQDSGRGYHHENIEPAVATARRGARQRATAAKDTAARASRLNRNASNGWDHTIGRAVVAHHTVLAFATVDLLARIVRAQPSRIHTHRACRTRVRSARRRTARAQLDVAERIVIAGLRASCFHANTLLAHLGIAAHDARATWHASAGAAELAGRAGLARARIHRALAADAEQTSRAALGVTINAHTIHAVRARQRASGLGAEIQAGAVAAAVANRASWARLARAGQQRADSGFVAIAIGRAGILLSARHTSRDAFSVDTCIPGRAVCVVVDHPSTVVVLAVSDLGSLPNPALALPTVASSAH